jgi:hypothetical protein
LAEIVFEVQSVLEEKSIIISFSPETKLADINQKGSLNQVMESASYTVLP